MDHHPATVAAAAPSAWGGPFGPSPPHTPPRPRSSASSKHVQQKPRTVVLSIEAALERGEGLGKLGQERAAGVRVEVTSPRALEACRRLGIDPKELVVFPPAVRPVSALASPKRAPHDQPPLPLPPEAEAAVIEHRNARLLKDLKMIKQERQAIIRSRGREQEKWELAWGVGHEAAGGADAGDGLASWSDLVGRAHGNPSPGPASSSLRAPPSSPAFGSPTRSHHGHSSHGIEESEGDVAAHAALIKSAMMEMENKRLETLKKRQEKEFQRMVVGEQKMVALQAKLLKAQEEEGRRKKEHERLVHERRRLEIEKKKQRDAELRLLAEEEQKKEKELHRRDALLKEKLTAEARAAERGRRKEAVAREMERHAKLEALRQRTEELLRQQEARAEAHRAVILERERRVKAQVEAKQARKAQEVLSNRIKAEKRIRAALERNGAAQRAKRLEYEARVAAARVRAEEKQQEVLKAVARIGEARRRRQERRDQRLTDAMQSLQARISRTLQRAAERSGFHAKAEAERARQAAVARVEEELRREDKEANARRLRRQQAFYKRELLEKQAADDARYERVKRERAYLQAQRKEAAHQAMLRKHRLKEAVEWMKVHNAFVPLDTIFSAPASSSTLPISASTSPSRRAHSPAPLGAAAATAAGDKARPASSML